MLRHLLPLLIAVAAAPLLAASAAAPGTGSAADLPAQRAAFAAALQLAERGPPEQARAAARALSAHPLAPYLDYALLRRQLATTTPERVRGFLVGHADSPLAGALRRDWLALLAERGDWTTWRAFDSGAPLQARAPEQRCAALRARLEQGTDAALLADIEDAWLSGHSQPALCDPAFAALTAAGRVTPALLWQRIALAAEAGETGLMRYLAGLLPAAQHTRARSYAAFLTAPSRKALRWEGDDALAARVAVLGLERLARHDPARAETLLAELAPVLGLDATQRGTVLYAAALWSAASYLPGSAQRFAAVPDAAWDPRLHEWQVREALARGAHENALQALARMPETQRGDPRWRYIEARLRAEAGDTQAARALLAPLAQHATYHGFLAADRLEQPYALCPRDAVEDPALRARMARDPALVRALELFALDRPGWAVREWAAALDGAGDGERRAAVALAVEAGWYDRAVFGLHGGEELAFYALRFPLDHGPHLARAAGKRQLDAAWVAALIRAESVWMAEARSPANARGLMQLVPRTGRAVARELGVRWNGPATLYQPLTNITLGTAYLRAMLDRFAGAPAVATAAYNAGPTPATRWQQQRNTDPVDLWIETIPYRETREYVARVFAFSVIYDWRLHGDAAPLTARLAGTTPDPSQRRSFACPDATASTTTTAGTLATRP